jgi:hypothetical protein
MTDETNVAKPSGASGGSAETERKTHTHSLQNTMPPRFDAAPYGVYRWAGGQPPGVTQVDNTLATMGRGQWLS